ncbi:hypothetical protein GCM10009737_13100 [Nocardioides lentus]|uniref:Uncharacterized protein n=1 Tax=Nocardioides lentus TaxID=338077 RepID=A0ABP5AJ00_9ACTN
MRRTTGPVVTVLAAGALLAGCGAVEGVVGGGTEAYCADLETAQQDFAGITGEGDAAPDAAAIESSIATFRDLGDAAPEAVADDWQVVNDNLDEREQVLADAGLTWSDLASLGPGGDLPDGTTEDDLTTLGTDLQALNTEDFADANEAIAAHARDECGLEAPRLPEG